MELSMVSLHKFSCKDPNIVLKSRQQPNRFAIFGYDTLMFELKNYPDSIDHINLEFQYGKSPAEYPISEIIKNNDMLSIYTNSTALEKQSITLNPLYASEFTEFPLEIRNINICWPDPINYSHKMDAPVAKLTNFGQLDIYTKKSITHDWEIFQFNINKVLDNVFSYNINMPRKNFKDLNSVVDNYFITCVCWEPLFCEKLNELPKHESLLFFSTASGWIVGMNILKNGPKFEFKLKTNLYKINCLETYRIKNDNNIYLIASDINGLIKIFKIERHNYIIKEICFLWNKADKIACNYFHLNYHNEKIVIVTAKGSYLLAFLLNTKNELLDTKNIYCETIVTGFDKVSLLNEYILTTKNGIVKYVKIEYQNENNIQIKTKSIKHDLVDIENYQIIGLISTSNFIGWIFVLIPRRIISNDANMKYPLILSFHQLNNIDPLSILKSSKSYNMSDFVDCNEIIRVKIQRDQFIDNYYKYSIQPIEVTKEFLHRLRIRLTIVMSICGYNLKKMKNLGGTYQKEKVDINILIKSLTSYFRIKYLITTYTDFSNFQKLSIKCARRNIIKYLQNENFTEDYLNAKNILENYYKTILEETEHLIKFTEEICLYCEENIDKTTKECVHNFLQCCISFVQIRTLEMKYCERCKVVALNNEDQLYAVMDRNEDFICPYCNYILLNSDMSS